MQSGGRRGASVLMKIFFFSFFSYLFFSNHTYHRYYQSVWGKTTLGIIEGENCVVRDLI